MLSRANKIVI